MNPKDASVRTGEPGVMISKEEAERFRNAEQAPQPGPGLVGFCPDGGSFRVCALARLGESPAHGSAQYWSRARRVWVHGEETVWRDGKEVREPGYRITIDLALDRFFLPNSATLPGRENEPGWEVEVSHRPGLTPLPRRLYFNGQPVVF
jgi:hypothetical protein